MVRSLAFSLRSLYGAGRGLWVTYFAGLVVGHSVCPVYAYVVSRLSLVSRQCLV